MYHTGHIIQFRRHGRCYQNHRQNLTGLLGFGLQRCHCGLDRVRAGVCRQADNIGFGLQYFKPSRGITNHHHIIKVGRFCFRQFVGKPIGVIQQTGERHTGCLAVITNANFIHPETLFLIRISR